MDCAWPIMNKEMNTVDVDELEVECGCGAGSGGRCVVLMLNEVVEREVVKVAVASGCVKSCRVSVNGGSVEAATGGAGRNGRRQPCTCPGGGEWWWTWESWWKHVTP
eukprot:2574043-Amphidinium_carterae.1